LSSQSHPFAEFILACARVNGAPPSSLHHGVVHLPSPVIAITTVWITTVCCPSSSEHALYGGVHGAVAHALVGQRFHQTRRRSKVCCISLVYLLFGEALEHRPCCIEGRYHAWAGGGPLHENFQNFSEGGLPPNFFCSAAWGYKEPLKAALNYPSG